MKKFKSKSNDEPKMNFTSLPVYYSKDSFTIRFADYSYVYVIPVICFFGISTNSANCIVTIRVKKGDHMINYILINSAIDFLFLWTEFFVFIGRCGTLCSFGYSYLAKLYELYFFLYLGHVLMTFQVIYNLIMTVERLMMFSSKRSSSLAAAAKKKEKVKLLLIALLIGALLLNAPIYLMAKEITEMGVYKINGTLLQEEILYARTTRRVFSTNVFKTILAVILILKNPVFYLIYGLINVLVLIKFHQFINKKNRLFLKSKCSLSLPYTYRKKRLI
jgi:hypothetical protein